MRFAVVAAALLVAAPAFAQTVPDAADWRAAGPSPVFQLGTRSADLAAAAEKDPTLAAILSGLVPGVGHMYAGEWGKGFLIAGGIVAARVGGRVGGVLICGGADSEGLPDCTAGQLVELAGIGVALGTYVYGIIDAAAAARSANEAAGMLDAGGVPVTLLSFSM